ncbi:MAG: hypothetical protein M1497_07210 [Nitrospirae bacterium]|nr:hypothetical protein [Nitrospirota bacterium]
MKELRLQNVRRVAKLCVLCAVLSVMATACGGKKEVKRESEESRTAQQAFAVAETLRTSYVQKDFGAVSESCSKEAYKAFMNSLKYFDSVELEFTPMWVEIDKTKVYLNVSWKGNWVVGKDTVSERGMAVFQLEGRPLKLTKIVRGSPFSYPEK